MLCLDLLDLKTVVLATAVLEKHNVNFPDRLDCLNSVVFCTVGQYDFNFFKETHRVHKQRPVKIVYLVVVNACEEQPISVDRVTRNWNLTCWLKKHLRDIHVLGVRQSLVQPLLYDLGRDI